MEARLVRATEGEVLVAYTLFLLQEDEDGLALDEIERPDDDVVSGGEGGLVLWSAGNDHYPHVRIELWSGEPPPSQEAWEAGQDTTFAVSVTGRLELTPIFGAAPDARSVKLPRLGSYQARVHVRGRQEARQRGEAQFFHGIEDWLLRIWPGPRQAESDEEQLGDPAACEEQAGDA
jgi:hypothetical protein